MNLVILLGYFKFVSYCQNYLNTEVLSSVKWEIEVVLLIKLFD